MQAYWDRYVLIAGRVFGLQEIIHTMLQYPLHPNNDINRFYIGGTYNNMTDVKL